MRTSLFPLQVALHERLFGDKAIQKQKVSVYESVPKNASFPYIALGEDTVNDWSTKLEYGEEVTHTIHVFSKFEGKKEVKKILSSILESLTKPLSLSDGFFIEFSRMDFMEVFTEQDGTTQHGIVRFRFKISQ
ncbi:MAG: DUF3168 domain-containing protein [Bacillaceae bacterium]